MSDDLNNKLKQIAELLGQENVPDNVKGLLGLLTGSAAKQPPVHSPEEVRPLKDEKVQPRTEMEENLDMFRKVKTVMDSLNNHHDPRIHLLTAIKPFLSSNRQKKLSNCINIIHMSNLTKHIDEHDKKNS